MVFDGSKGDILLDNIVRYSRNYQGLVGGGSILTFHTSFGDVSSALAGSRGKVVQKDNTKDVFVANGVLNPVLYGLDIKGGRTSASFISANQAKIVQINATEAASHGFHFEKSADVQLSDVVSFRNPYKGFLFVDSPRAKLTGITSLADKDDGLYFLRSPDASLRNVTVLAVKNGLYFEESERADLSNITVIGSEFGIYLKKSPNTSLDQVRVFGTKESGILVHLSNHTSLTQIQIVEPEIEGITTLYSDDVVIRQVTVTLPSAPKASGISINGGVNILLDEVSVKGKGAGGGSGVYLDGGGKIGQEVSFHNVRVIDADSGYIFSPGLTSYSAVKDLGGITVANVTFICGRHPYIRGIFNVLDTGTGMTHLCR